MKTIGILGGMTPESTTAYYTTIIREYENRKGDYGFPPIVIYSVSFQPILDLMNAGKWEKIADLLTKTIKALAASGADFVIIATNTIHIILDELRKASPIPIVSIIETTAEAIRKRGLTSVGLLGTKFTMSEPFYRDGLNSFGIHGITPNTSQQEFVNEVIFTELGKGIIKETSREGYLDIIGDLTRQGAEGIVMGCTEIPLLIKQEDCDTPLFDTAELHAEAALDYALSD